MADYPEQTPERRDEILRTSPLNARLGGRLSEAIGVIDVKHVLRHHARLTLWMAHRFPLLARFQTRYTGDELSGAQQSLVMQQAQREQVNPFAESPAQFSQQPAPPPFNATPPPPPLPAPLPAASSPAPPGETPQGKLRIKRRPPQGSPKYATAETPGTRRAAAPTEGDRAGEHIARAAEQASPASQTPTPPPPLVLSPSASHENTGAGAPPAATSDASARSRDTANGGEVSSATTTPASNPAREPDSSGEQRAREAQTQRSEPQRSEPRASEIARDSVSGGQTLPPLPLTKRAGDAASVSHEARAPEMFDANAPRDTREARGTFAAKGSELTLQRTSASGTPQGDASAAGRVTSSNAIQPATEINAAREAGERRTGFILRDDARRSEPLLRAQEATTSRRADSSHNAASAQAFAGTVRAEARQSLPLAQSTSTLTSSRPAADAPQADGRSVAFEIRDGARTASRRADSSRNAASAQTFAGTVSAEARQSLPLAQSTSTLTSSRPASDAPQADVRSVAFEIQDGARAAATGAARIVWRKGREGWSPDAAASFETDASVSSAVSSASSGASGASGAAAVSPATQSQSIVPAPVSTEARNGAANIERITEQVIRTLSRRMSVERERRGLRR